MTTSPAAKMLSRLDVQDGEILAEKGCESRAWGCAGARASGRPQSRGARKSLAGFLALVARSRGLAQLRADAAANAHLAVAGAARRLQIGQIYRHAGLNSWLRKFALIARRRPGGAPCPPCRGRQGYLRARRPAAGGASPARAPSARISRVQPIKLTTHLILSVAVLFLAMSASPISYATLPRSWNATRRRGLRL